MGDHDDLGGTGCRDDEVRERTERLRVQAGLGLVEHHQSRRSRGEQRRDEQQVAQRAVGKLGARQRASIPCCNMASSNLPALVTTSRRLPGKASSIALSSTPSGPISRMVWRAAGRSAPSCASGSQSTTLLTPTKGPHRSTRSLATEIECARPSYSSCRPSPAVTTRESARTWTRPSTFEHTGCPVRRRQRGVGSPCCRARSSSRRASSRRIRRKRQRHLPAGVFDY